MVNLKIKSYKARYYSRLVLGVLCIIMCVFYINDINSSYDELFQKEIGVKNSFNFDTSIKIIKPSDYLKLHHDITYDILNIIGYIGFGILLVIGDRFDNEV